jgi:hypothetical protein
MSTPQETPTPRCRFDAAAADGTVGDARRISPAGSFYHSGPARPNPGRFSPKILLAFRAGQGHNRASSGYPRCAWLSSVFASLPILLDSRPRRAGLHSLRAACSWPSQPPRGTAGFPGGLNQTVDAPNDASGVVVAPRRLGSQPDHRPVTPPTAVHVTDSRD